MSKRALTLLLAAALALSASACRDSAPSGGSAAASSVQGSAAPELTEADVLAAYEKVAEVYDWFDLRSLPVSGEPVSEDGRPYDPKQGGLPYQAVKYEGLKTYADLDVRVRSLFTQELADKIMGGGNGYRDIGGRLYAAGAARGSNLYLLGKAVKVEQTAPDRWAVAVTFYADSYDQERPNAVVGYSQRTLDYVKTPDGWRFSTFCPSDALDETAETVFRFSYDGQESTMERENPESWSDLKLACWLLNSDGAFSEGPSDTLSRRFLSDPDGWFAALSVFPDSPWENARFVMEAPAWNTYSWFPQEEQERFEEILDTYQPKNETEQALLDALKAARDEIPQELRAGNANGGGFGFWINDRYLALGKQSGDYPWGCAGFPEKPLFVGKGDNGELVYAFSYGGVDVRYYTFAGEDGEVSVVSSMETVSPDVETVRGVSVGHVKDGVLTIYSGAEYTGRIYTEDSDGAVVWPGDGELLGRHITFYITDEKVTKIRMEYLAD